MKKNILGKTGIEVTELCLGVLPIGPLQKNVPMEEASEVIALALEKGINFLDTAQAYGTYPHIRRAVERTGIRPMITSKAFAETYEDMEKAVLEALKELSIDYIDIFLLHAAKADIDVFEIRKGALQCLLDYKKKGLVKAVGIATHNAKVVEVAALNEDMDVVFPLINKMGRGILGGSVEDMQNAIRLCSDHGKGLYLMKILGGGTLIDDYESCMEFGRGVEEASSIALGMVSKEEVIYNIRYVNHEHDMNEIIKIRNMKNPFVQQGLCIGCGNCIEECHSNAISMNEAQKAFISKELCIQCGYCMAKCPALCIKIV